MNKKLLIVLCILLTLAGIAGLVYSAFQIVMGFLVRDYGSVVLNVVIALLCVEVTGTAIARLIKMRKKKS